MAGNVYEDLKPIANLKFGQIVTRVTKERTAKLSATLSDLIKRGMGNPDGGPALSARLNSALEASEQLCRGLYETWLELILRRNNNRLSREDVTFITDLVDHYAKHQGAKIAQAVRAPSRKDYVVQQAKTKMSSVASEISRELEIRFREQVAFQEAPSEGGDHQQPTTALNKPPADQAVGATVSAPQPDKKGYLYFVVGFIVALVPWGFQLIGITVNVWLGGFVLLLAFILMAHAFWIWEATSRWRTILRVGTVIAAASLYLLMVGRQIATEWKAEHNPPAASSSVPKNEPPIALFAECDITAFPIEIPPESRIEVVAINQREMRANKSGYDEIRNDTKKVKRWPDQKDLNRAARRSDGGLFPYRCNLSNHTTINLLDVALPMQFWFGDQKGPANLIYTPKISPLDAGKNFVLYFVNDCPPSAFAALPEEASVLVAGESVRRNTKLHLPNRSPLDQIMAWTPAKFRWINSSSCE